MGYVEKNFWLGTQFVDEADLNRQGKSWLDHIANVRIHGTTRERPYDRLQHEQTTLKPIPPLENVTVFLRESRKVAWDSFVSYSGNFYGVPWSYAGQMVEVQADSLKVQIFSGGQLIATHVRSAGRGARFSIEKQYDGLPRSGDQQRRKAHLAFQTEQIPEVQVEQRSLAEYDALVAAPSAATLDEMLVSVFPEGEA